MNDLVISVGANAGVSEISFTVQFDANVLQVRAGTRRGLGGRAPARRTFRGRDLRSEEDRVQIRSAVSGQRAGMAGGSVAIVQFQAVAPGTTSVLITDVVVKDLAGRSMATAVSASNLQVTVDSAPPRAARSRSASAVAVEPPTETTQTATEADAIHAGRLARRAAQGSRFSALNLTA